MRKQDYYLVLGVGRDETEQGIRDAFRELVRRHHPTRAGRRGAARFHDVLEAYHVLSDPHQRASYDRHLPPVDEASQPALRIERGPRRPIVEPLVPDPVSMMRDFHATRPSREEVYERVRGNFEPYRDARQRLDALRLEVVIGPDQAASGGMLTLGVPVFVPCDHCHGAGRIVAYRCAVCQGTGLREDERPARICLPPLVRDGTVYQVGLDGLGIRNMYLEVRIRVAS